MSSWNEKESRRDISAKATRKRRCFASKKRTCARSHGTHRLVQKGGLSTTRSFPTIPANPRELQAAPGKGERGSA
eukprot:4470159-Pleurochrysis_carterae.AAC.1